MNDEEQDDKTKELPLGKETEANLFKSRSIFIYGPINQELAQKVCSQLVALAAASDEDIRIYVNSPAAMSSPAIPSMTWSSSSSRRCG